MKLDSLYMDWVRRLEDQSHAVPDRRRVGCIIAKDDNVLSFGWNGTPTGFDNQCEEPVLMKDGDVLRLRMRTKPEVSHAELNALGKLAATGVSARGATLYVSLAPCIECAKLVQRACIEEVVYYQDYKNDHGINLLQKRGIRTRKISG